MSIVKVIQEFDGEYSVITTIYYSDGTKWVGTRTMEDVNFPHGDDPVYCEIVGYLKGLEEAARDGYEVNKKWETNERKGEKR